MKNVVITGVSTGIGYDTARHLTSRGYRVFGSVRRPEDAARPEEGFSRDFFVPLLFDVTDDPAIEQARVKVETALESLSEVYRRESLLYGVQVSSIQPGPIQSDLWDKNLHVLDKYEDTDYGRMARNVSRLVRRAQRRAKPAETIFPVIIRIICKAHQTRGSVCSVASTH